MNNAYNYGYGGYKAGLFAPETILLIVPLLFLIAAVVISALLYRKFVGKKANPDSSVTKFFRFDHLFIDKVIKFFYILDSLLIAVFCIYLPFSGFGILARNPGSFFVMLLLAIVVLVALELLNRLLYEGVMLFVRLVIDVGDIRSKIVGGKSMSDTLEDSSNAVADYAEKISEGGNKAKVGVANAVSATREKKAGAARAQAKAQAQATLPRTRATAQQEHRT